jgi:hypothetical protein
MRDYRDGKLRLLVINGERKVERYSGTNDGPFEIWYPECISECYASRYKTEVMVMFYNIRMRYPEKSLTTTNGAKP